MAKEELSLSQTKKKLQQVAELQKELHLQDYALYDVNNNSVDWNKKVSIDDVADFIDDEIDFAETPEQKELKMPEIPRSSFVKNFDLAATIMFFIGLIGIPIAISLFFYIRNVEANLESEGYVTSNLLIIPSILLAVVSILFICGIILMFKNKMLVDILGKKDKKRYNQALLEAQEIDTYNSVTYPKLLQEYEENRNRLIDEYLVKVNEAHRNIARIKNEIRKIDIVSDKYSPYAKELLELLQDNRADNLKEAINILVQEQKEAEYRKALIEQERVKNEILADEVRAREAELKRHNKELERASYQQASAMQQQARAQERQTELAKQQAKEAATTGQWLGKIDYTQCLQCAQADSCPKSGYCRGFVPKRR